ncbi:MAG TPA: hypothetical protein VIL42_03335 [Sphingomicrobium sp.]|jgi:hypothetical protein
MILRLLKPQAIAGITVAIALGLLLLLQKGETRHWKEQSSQFERLYADERTAFAATVANYRAAAERARAADAANLQRVAAEQRAISERTSNDYQARLAAAHALAQRLRGAAATAPADPRAGGTAPMPGLPAAAGRTAEGAGEDRLPVADALIATEQAIQLDELIKWVRAQAKVDRQGSR